MKLPKLMRSQLDILKDFPARAILIVSACANVAALLGLGLFIRVELPAIREARVVNAETLEEIENASIARAWQLLTTKSSGNSGKIEALEFLVERDVPLAGIDLSCDVMGGNWFPETDSFGPPGLGFDRDPKSGLSYCERPTYLEGVDLRGAILRSANLSGVNLARSDLREVDFSNANLEGAILTESILDNSILEKANLKSAQLDYTSLAGINMRRVDASGATFANSQIRNADLFEAVFVGASFRNSEVVASAAIRASFKFSLLAGASFGDVNISCADFTGSTGIKREGMWSWGRYYLRDAKPTGMPEGSYRIVEFNLDEGVNYTNPVGDRELPPCDEI
ncbi:pentapeptide repeat-containing protein [Heliomarina baculiformis]|uniref:pentapeptide repeat-containing protein n=1 Tax=Heliomarina baculiformis TaxID=2872036 RepID=UPI001EE25435|nr:pentapeptide repeat-containing protein [Heliomarina baculiformis]